MKTSHYFRAAYNFSVDATTLEKKIRQLDYYTGSTNFNLCVQTRIDCIESSLLRPLNITFDWLSTSRSSSAKSVIFFTDGRNRLGGDPVTLAADIRGLGARIISVGVPGLNGYSSCYLLCIKRLYTLRQTVTYRQAVARGDFRQFQGRYHPSERIFTATISG